MPNRSTSDVDLALAIACDPAAQTRFAGSNEPQKRGIWSKMNIKVKILTLAIPVGLAYAFMPFGHGGATPQNMPAPGSDTQAEAHASFPGAKAISPVIALASASPPASAPANPSASEASTASSASSDLFAKALPDRGAGMSSYQISQALSEVDLFAALATAVENFKTAPYYDPGGLNVGMGYCVTKRLSEYGSERVRADLSSAGFSPAEVDALAKNRKSEVAKIKVEPLHAARLLEATKEDYRQIAEGAIGAKTFSEMPPNRQAAMTYLAYNTGDVGKFKQLVSALQNGNDSKAMLNMTVNWRDADGLHANHRLRSYTQAMFLGADHFKRAISDPKSFESHMSGPDAESALADIAGAAQKTDGLKSKVLERRLRANPWAFKALSDEKGKLASAEQPKR